MTTTVQQIFDGALLFSQANTDAFKNAAKREILERVNYSVQELFTLLAQENRYYYATKATPASTAGASGRTVNLATLVPAVERLLIGYIPDGRELNPVDVQDQAADLAPRAYQLGEILYEVGNDWSAVAGPQTLTLYYVYRPAELDLTAGDLAALVATPDRFCKYHQLDLAWYFAHKDFGRAGSDPNELTRLEGERDKSYQAILTYLDHASGPVRRRFDLPVPTTTEKA